jgi:hypothetical protein
MTALHRNRNWYWAGGCFCLLMLAIHVAAARNITGVPDFWRDMYWATSIACGERFPLSGPPINNMIELGPWWYYLLALPIVLTHSVTAAAVFAQILAAGKYVFAWQIGTRAVDARFGVAFSVSLALAGWSTASLVFPSHTALVETTLLLLVVVTWRCRDRLSFGNAVAFGLACSACIHAHPTTATYVILASAIVLFKHRSPAALLSLCLAATVVVLTLAPPYLDHSAMDVPGFGVPKSLADYASRDVGLNVWSRLPGMLTGLGSGGAWTGFLLMTPWKMPAIHLAFALHSVCLGFALGGLFVLRREHSRLLRWFVYALLIVLAQSAFLLVIRPGTPIWMTQSCLPPLALAIALGWYGWFVAERRTLRAAAIGVFSLYALLDLAPFQRYLRHAHSNRFMPDSNPLADISGGGATFQETPIPFFSISQLDRLSRSLCEPVTLHARLASVIEHSLATPVRNACGFWPSLRYAGAAEAPHHVAGVSAHAVSAIGIAPDRLISGMAWYDDARAIAPPHGQGLTQLARMHVMPDAQYSAPGASTHEFETRARDVVVLTNRFAEIAPMVLGQITVNGQPAANVFDEGDLLVFSCSACAAGDTARWRIELNGIEENLDLVVIPFDKTHARDG